MNSNETKAIPRKRVRVQFKFLSIQKDLQSYRYCSLMTVSLLLGLSMDPLILLSSVAMEGSSLTRSSLNLDILCRSLRSKHSEIDFTISSLEGSNLL